MCVVCVLGVVCPFCGGSMLCVGVVCAQLCISCPVCVVFVVCSVWCMLCPCVWCACCFSSVVSVVLGNDLCLQGSWLVGCFKHHTQLGGLGRKIDGKCQKTGK